MHAETDDTKEGDPELVRIAEAHPGWKPWRSRLDDGEPGDWYATRKGRSLTPEEIYRGLESTLAADTPEQLVELIEAQAAKDIR